MSKTYSVSTQRQLIDLNGESTNFDLNFSAESEGDEPFEAVVVDQNMVDSNFNDVEYKQVEGHISGNIVADKNVYQNYYLALRAPKLCKIKLSIQKQEIPPRPQPPATEQQMIVAPTQNTPQKPVKKGWSRKTWIFIGIGVAVVIGCLAYYYFSRKKTDEPSTPITKKDTKSCPIIPSSTPVFSPPPMPPPMPPPKVTTPLPEPIQVSTPKVQVTTVPVVTPSLPETPKVSVSQTSNTLIDRLKRLPLPQRS